MLRPRSQLTPVQIWGADLIRRQSVILAWDMGARKTATTLTAIADMLAAGEVKKVLVVAPLNVAAVTWPDEIEAWEHTRDIPYSIIIGEEGERAIAAASPAPIHLVNKENLVWLWKHFEEGKNWPYDMLVVDEASMLKNAEKRTTVSKDQVRKALEKDIQFWAHVGLDYDPTKFVAPKPDISRFGVISKARSKFKRIVELTGTPNPNGLKNLWGIAYPIDGGQRLGWTKSAFEKRWFTVSRYDYKVTPTEAARREIPERLKDIMFSLPAGAYPPLEDPVIVPRYVELSPKHLEAYQRFKRTLVSEEFDVEAVNAAVLTNKLLQFANGSMYRDDGDPVHIHDEKLNALSTMVDEQNGSPLLVFYSFKFDLERIRKRYPKAVVLSEEKDTRAIVKRWNEGGIEILLAHPASAGHGLNLQFGGNVAVWYGLNFDLELYQQANKRLHRPGQEKVVFIHQILAQKTVDMRMVSVLENKRAEQDMVLEAVRAEITL